MKISIRQLKNIIRYAEDKNHTWLNFNQIENSIYSGIKVENGYKFYEVEYKKF